MTADPKALHHVLQKHDDLYDKRIEGTELVRMMIGRGILWASGEFPLLS